ncbi:MAG TPA: hypothetical protein VI485_07170 [Vicinamibacterales bacterium]|nr:hypothetical protein [Vicinamibacterales bacterium]
MPDDAPKKRIRTLLDVLAAAGVRPRETALTSDERRKLAEDKRTYATRFANKMAICIANGLREQFPGVLPDEDGKGVESPAQSVRGPKKLDVNYSTPQLGLGFGISLKAVHFSEKEKRGYLHNTKRNDEELRSEASGYHQRQPYAVMIAVLFVPDDACEDASDRGSSSFGGWVKYLRPLGQRQAAHEDIDRYERVFVGLYSRDGSRMEFFDVANAPPKRGRPKNLLNYGQFLDEVEKTYLQRNAAEFEWADDVEVEIDEEPPDDET